ncbi:MAG TPA: ATP-binding cassette domain-containing protein [Ktedonobacteraceae bacterium]|nr:ATP-binding cassette domain-containing protein [Ktedonobacteraceae bacterium]
MTEKIDTTAAIACLDLTKVYETGAAALQDLTLTIERGMSFGLLGENGAGKSTLVRLIMDFLFPTSGTLLSSRASYSRGLMLATALLRIPLLVLMLLLKLQKRP